MVWQSILPQKGEEVLRPSGCTKQNCLHLISWSLFPLKKGGRTGRKILDDIGILAVRTSVPETCICPDCGIEHPRSKTGQPSGFSGYGLGCISWVAGALTALLRLLKTLEESGLVLNMAMIDANSSAPAAFCCVRLFISVTARLI